MRVVNASWERVKKTNVKIKRGRLVAESVRKYKLVTRNTLGSEKSVRK